MGIKVTVAGRTVNDALSELEGYAAKHGKTLKRYDLADHGDSALTLSMVAATRVVSSRISNQQAAQLVEIVNSVNWTQVPPGSLLKSADPTIEGGLFDAASALYQEVRERAPKDVKAGKISKVLHLMRPGLFPILDSRIRNLYRVEARNASVAIKVERSTFPYSETYWGAIRNDIFSNEGALLQLRSQAAESANPLVKAAAERVTDVRLLDLLAWKI